MLVIKHSLRPANSCLSTRIIANQEVLVNHYSNQNKIGPRVAVILSGSGVYDGSEIHEASAILVHLSRCNARTQIFAPDIPQFHVVNHVKCEPALSEKRNVLVESARIARGHIQPLSTLSSDNHDGLVLPGGFGVAKNLSTFVVDGPNCKVISDIEKVIKQFHFSQKPMAMCCIAPVLAAKVIKGCELTVGYDQEDDGKWPYASTVEAVEQMGCKHTNCNVNEIIVDEKNLLVSTPAFMCGTAPLHEIYDGIGRMIEAFMKLIQKKV